MRQILARSGSFCKIHLPAHLSPLNTLANLGFILLVPRDVFYFQVRKESAQSLCITCMYRMYMYLCICMYIYMYFESRHLSFLPIHRVHGCKLFILLVSIHADCRSQFLYIKTSVSKFKHLWITSVTSWVWPWRQARKRFWKFYW